MSKKILVSFVVPFYNAESYIKACLDVLLNQDFPKPFEIIMVDDASTDNCGDIVKMNDNPVIRLYSLATNSGPGAARNVGLQKAKGEYVFFLDVDDTIAANTLTTMYGVANETNCDLVFCDFKRIENSVNQRDNIFNYPSDQSFGNSDISESMRTRLHDPLSSSSSRLFALNGRLIRRSIISENNILFQEELRYLEDETFMWDVLAFVQSASYIRKQMYSYHVFPNVNTALSEGISQGFPVSYFKLIKSHIQNCLKQRGFSVTELKKLGDQAFIFFIINALISYSRSMIQGKVEFEFGVKCRRKIIDDIFADHDVSKSIRNYSRSQEESRWIPLAIAWRSRKFLEFACNRRAKQIWQRRKSKEIS